MTCNLFRCSCGTLCDELTALEVHLENNPEHYEIDHDAWYTLGGRTGTDDA